MTVKCLAQEPMGAFDGVRIHILQTVNDYESVALITVDLGMCISSWLYLRNGVLVLVLPRVPLSFKDPFYFKLFLVYQGLKKVEVEK